MIRGKREGSTYSTWFIGFDHEPQQTTGPGSDSPSSHTVGGSRPVSRAGSVDALSLHSSSSTRQLRPRTPEPTKRLRAKDADKLRTSSNSLRALPKWDEDVRSKGQVKKVTKDLYKHAFETARKAEEQKFKAKFDVLLNDLHRTLDVQSPHGLVDSFASTSYGEVMLSFRERVKDLLIVFSRRLQLAYESFESRDSSEDHSQQVKQSVSRFLEDLLGESLDPTSDEAVSDLSSLSDDSANDRHAFEDQIAQAVVSKLLDTHRREVHHGLHEDHSLDRPFDSSSLIPAALDDDDDDDANRRVSPDIRDTDISKDFQDLKNFVQETQSRSRQFDDLYSVDSVDGGEGVTDFRTKAGSGARASSSFDVSSRERDYPSLPDFSDFEQLDFESAEVDPDLLQMNLAVIPEETEEELEADAQDDSDWRENWLLRNHGLPVSYCGERRRIKGDNGPPQYMMVPSPDDNLAPRVGNRDVDQLSDLLDETTDNDHAFCSGTSEELARISKFKQSTTPLSSASLIPNNDDLDTNHMDDLEPIDSLRHKKSLSSVSSNIYEEDSNFEGVNVGTEDFVGPIVEPTHKELKLLDDLVPADDDDPRFVLMPDSVTIQEGDPVKFSCRVSGTQPIDVFWYREHDEVEELEESEDIELIVDGDRHSAALYNVSRQHAGQYMCIALSDVGKAIKYLTVTVKDSKQELKKPEFLKEIKDVEVFEGQSVKFRCKVKGYPPPRIYWYKDGTLLKSNRSCRIEKFGNRDYILTMDRVTMDDDAEYMVMARNVAGEVKSTAQVIVEPQAEGQSQLSKIQSQSLNTVYTDSDSDRASSVMTDDTSAPSETSHKDMTRQRSYEAPLSDSLRNKLISGDSTVTEEDGKPPRKLTSSALGVLRVAEEIIQTEKSASNTSSTAPTLISSTAPTPRPRSGISMSPSPSEENKTVFSSQPSPTSQSDLNKSVSSGYDESSSMTSSALDFTDSDSGMVGSSLSHRDNADSVWSRKDPLSPEDEFAMYLPPLDDDGAGSYREEVSISLSTNTNTKTNIETPSTVSQTSPSKSSRRTRHEPQKSTSPSEGALHFSSPMVPSAQKHPLSHQQKTESGIDELDSERTEPGSSSESTDSTNLVLNFGPKEIKAAAYNRDYVVKGREEEGVERKRWSVTLDPYSPAAEIVNRQRSVDEAEEKIPTFDRGESTLQISPRSSRGGSSNSSTISTSRESLDSGVSSTQFTPERPERPLPVHMVGQTQEEEVPESRAEYDADSGIELPSVSRIKALFTSNKGGKEEIRSEGNFKRIHSITARSMSKDQLQKLKDVGNAAQQRESRTPTRSNIHLNILGSSQRIQEDQPGTTAVRMNLSQRQQTPVPSVRQTPVPAERRRIRTPNPAFSSQSALVHPPQGAQSASNLVTPTNSYGRMRSNSPRPKSAIIDGSALSIPNHLTPRARAHSDSDSAGDQGVAAKPKVRSGCISARAAFWERRIQQGEGAGENMEEEFPGMIQDSQS